MIYKTYRIINHFIILFLIPIILHSCVSRERQSDFEIPVFSDQYQRIVETLSSDAFEGRAPTTPGGKKTKAFIESEFRRIGLKPANGNSYRQAVPLVEINMKNFSDLVITSEENDTLSYSYIDQMVIGTTRLTDSVRVVDSELVFAGYGIVAPEYNWNDYDGLDVKGKTVVVLVNDPGYELGDAELFTGTAMTYYGRWTYKYEEAARQGATGVLIVHETGPAGYGWDVVKNSWTGPQFEVGGNSNGPATEMQGWIQQDVAEEIFEAAGMTLAEAKQQAQNPGFKPFSLDLKISFSFDVKVVQSQSYNIAGYVEGSEYPDETIIYMAHWDHLGKVETPDGPRIYNGAIDNATGVAAIMAIAEKFTAMNPAPKRSVVFIAVTAEESGLIGSRYYAQNPLFPVETTVGGINIDGLNVYGPTNDVVVIGYNASQLQETLKRHAADQERVLVPEKYPERGYFYRSDHFNLVREGVPMIYANSGEDFIGKDESFARFVKEDMEMRYHSPMDVINENWNWNGLHQNLWLFYNVGKELANSDDWPEWNEGSEFKAIRETSAPLRRYSQN